MNREHVAATNEIAVLWGRAPYGGKKGRAAIRRLRAHGIVIRRWRPRTRYRVGEYVVTRGGVFRMVVAKEPGER